MSYSKNIAIIKPIQVGFSADGGPISGLIKAEQYFNQLKVEVSLINFAPLTEGRYVVAISNGPNTQIVENGLFEGQSNVDTSNGFGAVVCFVNDKVQLVATAVCGNFQSAVFGLKSEIERQEGVKRNLYSKNENTAVKNSYDDEAIAGENYYEFDAPDEGGKPVCKDTEKEKDGGKLPEDETYFNAVKEETIINLAGGDFFKKMQTEIDGLLSNYPPVLELCAAVDNSKWVKISYGEDSFYVFGVIFSDSTPKYLCYGIPAQDESSPPASMQDLAGFLDVKTQYGVGFWVIYQDADTGASIKISQK